MTKKKQIEILQERVDILTEINKVLKEKTDIMQSFVEKMPDDCVMGKHCEICVHRKVFHVNTTNKKWALSDALKTITLCGKHMTCKGFATEYKLEIPPRTDPYKPGVMLLNNTDNVDKVIE